MACDTHTIITRDKIPLTEATGIFPRCTVTKQDQHNWNHSKIFIFQFLRLKILTRNSDQVLFIKNRTKILKIQGQWRLKDNFILVLVQLESHQSELPNYFY
jgi:hypothetical protein